VLVEDVEQVAVEFVGRVALRLERVPLLSRSRRVLFGLAVGLTSTVLPAGMPGAAFATCIGIELVEVPPSRNEDAIFPPGAATIVTIAHMARSFIFKKSAKP
jgi:hypothetical protein